MCTPKQKEILIWRDDKRTVRKTQLFDAMDEEFWRLRAANMKLTHSLEQDMVVDLLHN